MLVVVVVVVRSLLLVSLPVFVCHCLFVCLFGLVLLWVVRNSLQKEERGGVPCRI